MNEVKLIDDVDRVITLNDIDQSSVNDIIQDILKINKSDAQFERFYDIKIDRKPIEIYIDSDGGEIYSSNGLISIIQESLTPIHTICTGRAMSAALNILINGHVRFGYKNSSYMYHQLSTGGYGNITEMDEHINNNLCLQSNMEDMYMNKTNIHNSLLMKIRKEKLDYYFSSDEAIKLGVIDYIK